MLKDILREYNDNKMTAIEAHDSMYVLFVTYERSARKALFTRLSAPGRSPFTDEADRKFALEVLELVMLDLDDIHSPDCDDSP